MTSIIGGSCMEERGDLLFELKNIQSNKTYTRQNQMKTAEKERKSISCNFYISLIFVCIHLNIVEKSCKFCEINYHQSHSPFSPQSIKLLLKKQTNMRCGYIPPTMCPILVIMHAELYKVVRYIIYFNSKWELG